jgi:Domain of unknown function (DUF4157)
VPSNFFERTCASVGEGLAGPGRPLASQLRQDMERRFDYDFSNVRVHCDAAVVMPFDHPDPGFYYLYPVIVLSRLVTEIHWSNCGDPNVRELEPDRGLAASARPPAGGWVERSRAYDRHLRTLADGSPEDSQWRHFAAFAAIRTSSCVKTA